MGQCRYCGKYINGNGYCSRKCEDDEARSDREHRQAYEKEQAEKRQAHDEYLRTTSVNSMRCLKLSLVCWIAVAIALETQIWWMLFFPLIPIILGHSGLRQIKQSEIPLKGKFSAILGLSISYFAFVMILLAIFSPTPK